MSSESSPHVVVIGAGFCGLAAAYEFGRHGFRVTVLEQDSELGGLAGSFTVGGQRLEKFYHHWFTNDRHIMQLVEELDCEDQVIVRPTRTGMYFANHIYRLSTPVDLLRFSPLGPFDRLRLGLLALRARQIRDWRALEQWTAAEWLRKMAGERVYRVVWEPLLRGKFGDAADDVSAVWFWNKLKLRGGSRGKGGEEQLAYFRGGFSALADRISSEVDKQGGNVKVNSRVDALLTGSGRVNGVLVGGESLSADHVLATIPLPRFSKLVRPHVTSAYTEQLQRIRYLANLCVVLELDRSLSDTYWLNVNDPGFPFVGVIEHTRFEPSSSYDGRHIIYLSKYLPPSSPLYQMDQASLVDYTLGHLQRMFPALKPSWVLDAHVWRAPYSQPIVERNYGALIPPARTPLAGLFLASMAQIYPEDRGTNYAIRQGRDVARQVVTEST